jgi:hypothetical protein
MEPAKKYLGESVELLDTLNSSRKVEYEAILSRANQAAEDSLLKESQLMKLVGSVTDGPTFDGKIASEMMELQEKYYFDLLDRMNEMIKEWNPSS